MLLQTGIQVPFWIRVCPDICPGVKLLEHMIAIYLVFKRISILFSIVAAQFTFPSTVWEGYLFSTPSPAFIVCRLFDGGHSDWCEMIPHCSFDLHFSNNEWCWTSFHIFLVIYLSSLEKVYLDLLLIFLIEFFVCFCCGFFFYYWATMSCWCILKIKLLSVASFANIFCHSEDSLFILFMISFAVQKLLV